MSSNRSRIPVAVALAVLGIATPRAAHADEIFSNLGAPTEPTGWVVGGPNTFRASLSTNQEVAQDFFTGPSAYNNIVFEGRFQYIGGTNGLTLRLHKGGATTPDEGQVLATSPSLLAPGTPGIVTWTLDPMVTLEANTTYWFSASATFDNGYHAWRHNTTGDTGFAYRQPVNFGPTWFPSSGTASAFRVTGSTAVPEPSEWAAMGIFGAGLAGLVLRKRRKI